MPGNQYASPKVYLVGLLDTAREFLRCGNLGAANEALGQFWRIHARAPRSTQRRWKCGR